MMRFKIMGSRHGLAVAVAAGLGWLVATASPATEPQRQAGPPVWVKPGAPQHSTTIPPFNAPSLDLVDVADAVAHEPIRDASGAVVCLAGCNGPRGMVVHVAAHGPVWQVASIDAPGRAEPRTTASPAPLAAECIAGCDRNRGAHSERSNAAGVRLPERAANTHHDDGRVSILARRQLAPTKGRPQLASLATGRKSNFSKRRGATWAVAQRAVRVR